MFPRAGIVTDTKLIFTYRGAYVKDYTDGCKSSYTVSGGFRVRYCT